MASEAVATLTDKAYESLRRRVYLRHGGYCIYCGRVLRLHETRLDLDSSDAEWHRVAEETLSCACPDCHQDRGRRTRAEYLAHRRVLHARQMLHALNGR